MRLRYRFDDVNVQDLAYKPDQSRQQTHTQPQQSSLYSLLAKPTSPVASSIFGGGGSSSSQSTSLSGAGIFGQTPGNVNPFQQQSTPSIFGSGTSNFPSASFPNAAQPQQQPSLFGQGQPLPASAGSIFGGSVGSQAPAPAFGSQPVFGVTLSASAPPFVPAAQPQQTPSLFGGSFGQGNLSSSSIFGAPASSVMPQQAQHQQPSMFGAQPSPASSFGAPQSQAFGTDASASHFAFKPEPTMGSTPTQSQASLLNANAPGVSPRDKFVYSDMSELTPEDIAAYEADSFTSCENIPQKAPPKELCR